MEKKELKKIIKQLVRESLTEIFVEMKLETIVENVVKKQTQGKSTRLTESRQSLKSVDEVPIVEQKNVSSPTESKKQKLREFIRENVAPSNREMASIYEDILNTENPLATGDENSAQELVSEEVLEKMGIMNKDFSRLL